jgi:hypothetical protein
MEKKSGQSNQNVKSISICARYRLLVKGTCQSSLVLKKRGLEQDRARLARNQPFGTRACRWSSPAHKAWHLRQQEPQGTWKTGGARNQPLGCWKATNLHTFKEVQDMTEDSPKIPSALQACPKIVKTKTHSSWAPVAHACNPSYSGADQDCGLKPAHAKSLQDPISKNPSQKKGW